MTDPISEQIPSSWWHNARAFTRLELIADAVVHGFGLVIATSLGTVIIVLAAFHTAPAQMPAIAIYVASLILVLSVSLAFNLAPVNDVKRVLARFDQAAIFLLVAGTYTPLLALLGGTQIGQLMLMLIWAAAIVVVALKLLIPQHFGRLALVLYLGIGWSGIFVFQTLAETLPHATLWLLLAGGIAYSTGIIFHVWEKLHFHNVVWHCFVVAGATLHLWAILDCMVLSRL